MHTITGMFLVASSREIERAIASVSPLLTVTRMSEAPANARCGSPDTAYRATVTAPWVSV